MSLCGAGACASSSSACAGVIVSDVVAGSLAVASTGALIISAGTAARK